MKRQQRVARARSSPSAAARRFTWPMTIAALSATIAVAGAAAVAMRFVMRSEPIAATSLPSSGPLTPRAPSGMVWIPGGEFTYGHRLLASPGRRSAWAPRACRAASGWMRTEVTNAQFGFRQCDRLQNHCRAGRRTGKNPKMQFRRGRPSRRPGPLVPGSLVFAPPGGPVIAASIIAVVDVGPARLASPGRAGQQQ